MLHLCGRRRQPRAGPRGRQGDRAGSHQGNDNNNATTTTTTTTTTNNNDKHNDNDNNANNKDTDINDHIPSRARSGPTTARSTTTPR